jgi:hypothetical protein
VVCKSRSASAPPTIDGYAACDQLSRRLQRVANQQPRLRRAGCAPPDRFVPSKPGCKSGSWLAAMIFLEDQHDRSAVTQKSCLTLVAKS